MTIKTRVKVFTGFIDQYLTVEIVETAALNVSTERFKTIRYTQHLNSSNLLLCYAYPTISGFSFLVQLYPSVEYTSEILGWRQDKIEFVQKTILLNDFQILISARSLALVTQDALIWVPWHILGEFGIPQQPVNSQFGWIVPIFGLYFNILDSWMEARHGIDHYS